TGVELPVRDDESSLGSKHPDPFVDRRLRVRQCPQQMTAHDKVEAAGRERELLGVGLLKADRDAALGRFAPRLGKHRRREVDAGARMTARCQLEAEKPCAAAPIERVERATLRQHKIEDAVPSGALAWRANAVPEILVEIRRPPAPMGGDL